MDRKFDPKKIPLLNDPKRLEYLDPDFIWEKAGLKNPQVLVDIGAGTGFFALVFSGKMKGGRIYACDVSGEMTGWMEQNLPPESRGRIIPLKMEETSVPLPDGVADLVYMINLHHELEDPLNTLKEAYRLLKEGGKLMIIDWKKEATPQGPPLEIRYTEDEIGRQMRECGFTGPGKYAIPYHHFLIGRK